MEHNRDSSMKAQNDLERLKESHHSLQTKFVKLAKKHKAIRATVEGWRDDTCKIDNSEHTYVAGMRNAYQRLLDLLDGKLPPEIKPTETIIEEQDDAR